jgi:hypothetical protein
LFYFGYVSTLVRYDQFGVDLTMLDLSTIDILLLGTEVIFPPLAGLLVIGLAGLVAHGGVRTLLRRDDRRAAVVVAALAVVAGAAMFVRGMVGILWVQVSIDEFPGVTAVCFGFGVPLLAYGVWVYRRALGHTRQGRRTAQELALLVGLIGIMILGMFWTTNNFAAAYGRGRANELAAELHTMPLVVLDLTQALYLPQDVQGVIQYELPRSEDAHYRVRCQGLRLLTEAGGRLFLVPPEWTGPSRRTIVVPNDGTVRLQLLPN